MTIIFHEGRKDRHLPRLNKIKSLRRAIIYSQKSLHNQDEYLTFVPTTESAVIRAEGAISYKKGTR